MPWLRTTLFMTVLLVAQPAMAQGTVQLILPRTPIWARVIYQDSGRQEVARYVLKGQTDKDWTEMLTVQVSPGSSLTVGDLATRVFAGTGTCAENDTRGPYQEVVNGYRSALYRSSCRSPKLPEGEAVRPAWLKDRQVSVTKAIWTVDNTYIVTRVWRGDAVTADHPDKAMKGWARFFKGVQVCDPGNLKRACRAWGVLSRRDARKRAPAKTGAQACDVLDQLMVEATKVAVGTYAHRLTAEIDQKPFFSEARGRAFAVKALKATHNGGPVSINFGLAKGARQGVEQDQRRVREETLALRQFLADNGVEGARMRIALNAGCIPG